jgi:hypothetical protein
LSSVSYTSRSLSDCETRSTANSDSGREAGAAEIMHGIAPRKEFQHFRDACSVVDVIVNLVPGQIWRHSRHGGIG